MKKYVNQYLSHSVYFTFTTSHQHHHHHHHPRNNLHFCFILVHWTLHIWEAFLVVCHVRHDYFWRKWSLLCLCELNFWTLAGLYFFFVFLKFLLSLKKTKVHDESSFVKSLIVKNGFVMSRGWLLAIELTLTACLHLHSDFVKLMK